MAKGVSDARAGVKCGATPDIMGLRAHEFAHAVLRHPFLPNFGVSRARSNRHEIQALELLTEEAANLLVRWESQLAEELTFPPC